MPVSLAIVAPDVVLQLNAGSAGAYSSVVTDPRWNTTQVVDAILTADGMVCQASYRNRENARASLYYTTQTGLANGATIAGSAGDIVSIEFVIVGGSDPGTRPSLLWNRDEIAWMNKNPSGVKYDARHVLEGRRIYHNGASIAASESATVSVNAIFPTYTRSSACQAADEYTFVVFVGAMAILVPVEGENAGVAGGWGSLFQNGLAMIATGEGNLSREFEESVKRRMAA